MWHNGAAVDYQLVNCFNGFFVQVTVDVNSILMDNIWLAAPLIIPQLHIDQVVLTDPQLLQVTAFVPGGDTLISSRSLTMIEKRNRVFTILDSTPRQRQRFTDMRNVGFLLLTAHPSSKWMDPAFSPQNEKVVVVYSDEVLQGSASVLLRLSLPPHDAEGAIYVRRRLRLRYLIRQLGISPLCGDVGDECLCYVNGMELTNDREMAVDDAAFIHCWGLPLADSEEAELVTIGDSTSQHSFDVHMPVYDRAMPPHVWLSIDQRDPENDKRTCICMPSVVAGRFVSRVFVFLACVFVLETLRFYFSSRTGSCIPLPDKH